MNSGLVYCFRGALSFGLLSCASKFAPRKNCQASTLVVLSVGWPFGEIISPRQYQARRQQTRQRVS